VVSPDQRTRAGGPEGPPLRQRRAGGPEGPPLRQCAAES